MSRLSQRLAYSLFQLISVLVIPGSENATKIRLRDGFRVQVELRHFLLQVIGDFSLSYFFVFHLMVSGYNLLRVLRIRSAYYFILHSAEGRFEDLGKIRICFIKSLDRE